MFAKKKKATFSGILVRLQLDTPFRFDHQWGRGDVGTMSPGSSEEMEINCTGSSV